MTIDHAVAHSGMLRRLVRSTLILAGLVFGWFATMASVMLTTEIAPAALVIAPDAGLLGRLDDNTRLLKGGRRTFVLTSTAPGYVRDLYGAGAWLVLPALRNGCLDLRTLQAPGTDKPIDKRLW